MAATCKLAADKGRSKDFANHLSKAFLNAFLLVDRPSKGAEDRHEPAGIRIDPLIPPQTTPMHSGNTARNSCTIRMSHPNPIITLSHERTVLHMREHSCSFVRRRRSM